MSNLPVGSIGNETGFIPKEGSKLKPAVKPGGDSDQFNKLFEEKKALSKKRLQKNQEKKINKMNVLSTKKKLHELNIKEILIGIKDTWFEFLDDLLQHKFAPETLTKNNRMFFLGISFVVIMILLYTYDTLTVSTGDGGDKQIIEHHYIYHNKPPTNDIPVPTEE
jgi:hypothetical protein